MARICCGQPLKTSAGAGGPSRANAREIRSDVAAPQTDTRGLHGAPARTFIERHYLRMPGMLLLTMAGGRQSLCKRPSVHGQLSAGCGLPADGCAHGAGELIGSCQWVRCGARALCGCDRRRGRHRGRIHRGKRDVQPGVGLVGRRGPRVGRPQACCVGGSAPLAGRGLPAFAFPFGRVWPSPHASGRGCRVGTGNEG